MMKPMVSRHSCYVVIEPNYTPSQFIQLRSKGSRLWNQADRETIDVTGDIARLGEAMLALKVGD